MGRPFQEIGLDKSLPHLGVLMKKETASDYPRYALPDDYRFVYYQSGMERDWMELQFVVENIDNLAEAESIFVHDFVYNEMNWENVIPKTLDPAILYTAPCARELAKRMFFVADPTGLLVATMTLWHGKAFGTEVPRIHWVAVHPEIQGKGIARAMLTEACGLCARLGYTGKLYLATQTWNYRAIYLYEKFGFQPYIGEELKDWLPMWQNADAPFDYEKAQTDAWQLIHEKIVAYQPK